MVDKATKLETIIDGIETIRTRFAVLKREAEIDHLKAPARGEEDGAAPRRDLEARLAALDDDLRFLEEANIGGEFMDQEKRDRVHEIAKLRWRASDGDEQDLLSEKEVENLCISRGTLNQDERQAINNHVSATIEMLEQLPFPKTLARVPEYAGGHHERMDGTGYPRGLKGDQMSIPVRMVAIADVFEALTAADRPYKGAKTLSESIKIMSFMKNDGHIDPELFDLFLEAGVHRRYAEQHLRSDQIDDVDVATILGKGPARDNGA